MIEPSAPPLLQTRDLARVFPGGRGVRGVSIALARGEKALLLGPNGAGKTTLLRLLAGVLRPGAGGILRAEGLRIRYLPAREPFYDDLPLAGDLALLAAGTGTAEPPPDPLGPERAGLLSSGERRRAFLAWALASETDLLLLDEPSAHLDEAGRGDLARRLAEFPGAVLASTHDEALFLPDATDRRIRLVEGRLA